MQVFRGDNLVFCKDINQ